MSLYNTYQNISENVAKASLPGTVASATFFGYDVPFIVQCVTLVWLGIIIVDKLWDMYRKYRKDKDVDPIE